MGLKRRLKETVGQLLLLLRSPADPEVGVLSEHEGRAGDISLRNSRSGLAPKHLGVPSSLCCLCFKESHRECGVSRRLPNLEKGLQVSLTGSGSPQEERRWPLKQRPVTILLCPNKEKWPGPVASHWWGTQEEALPILKTLTPPPRNSLFLPPELMHSKHSPCQPCAGHTTP